MAKKSIVMPIATRLLHCQIEGKSEEVIVRFGAPKQEGEHFTCEYEISIAADSETFEIIGVDSVQALQLAMVMVGSSLKGIPGATNWSCNGEPDTGFPASLDEPIVGLRF